MRGYGSPLINGPDLTSQSQIDTSSTTNQIRNVDHPSYLLPTPLQGKCDIFFPINFPILYSLLKSHPKSSYKGVIGDNNCTIDQSIELRKSWNFMMEFGDISKTKLKNGYNPLIQVYYYYLRNNLQRFFVIY